MALEHRLLSTRFPFLPLTIIAKGMSRDVEALLDTGFDGEVIVPQDFFAPTVVPDITLGWTLADGRRVQAPGYIARVQIGAFASIEVLVTALGDEALVGRGVSDHFLISLDHGRQLIVEP